MVQEPRRQSKACEEHAYLEGPHLLAERCSGGCGGASLGPGRLRLWLRCACEDRPSRYVRRMHVLPATQSASAMSKQGLGIASKIILIGWLTIFIPGMAGSTYAVDAELTGQILDADSGKPIAARLYIKIFNDKWFLAKSKVKEGRAVPYSKIRAKSREVHTCLSAHPFVVRLPAGRYTIIAERGKEYLPAQTVVHIQDKPVEVTLKLKRWIHMAKRGRYSGTISRSIRYSTG